MTLLEKILTGLLITTILGAGLFIWYKEKQMTQMQTDIQNSMTAQKQLLDGITRAQSSYVSKSDLDAFATQNKIDLATIQKDVDTLGASISGINTISVGTKSQTGTNLPSTNTTPAPTSQIPTDNTNPDPFGYLKNTQHLTLNETFSDNTIVPFGDVGFSASQQKPWSTNIPARTYNVSSVIATDAEGKETLYNKFSVNVNNKDYPIAINQSQFVQQYPSPSFTFFNPRLYLGLNSGVNLNHVPIQGSMTPSLNFGMMSYGSSLANPDLSFAQIGIGYEAVQKVADVQISPFQYNLGQHISNTSLIRNTFIGPSVEVLTNGNFIISGGIRVGL